MKISKKTLVFLLVALVVISFAAFALTNTEIRIAIIGNFNQSYIKYGAFKKLSNSRQDIYILGTIHTKFLTSKGYTLMDLESVIQQLKPDLLLVESRPEELQKDNVGDGPIEMPFSNLFAQSLGIRTDGMDWWTVDNVKFASSNDIREDMMTENILKRIPGYNKVLVLCGYSHVNEFVTRLGKAGYKNEPFSKKDKDKLFSLSKNVLIFPKGMKHYIQKRIDLETEVMKNETDSKIRSKYENVISDRQKLKKLIDSSGEKQ